MIYRKDEFVQDDTGDDEFPIKQIDRLEPIDGSASRFIGRAALNMQTPFGIQQVPVSFEIEASTIEEAFARYSDACRPKIEELRQQLQARLDELRRQEQTRIVTPGDSGGIISINDLKRQ